MAFLLIRDQAVYLDGYDLQARTKAVQIDYSAALQDATVLGSTTMKRLGGLKSVVASVRGNMDIDTTDAAMFADISLVDKALTFSAADDTAGSRAFFFKAGLADLKLGAAVGEVAPFELDADASSSNLVSGTIMVQSRLAALTTTGNGTARQLGAVSASQFLYSALHVWNVGTGTVTVSVKSDATNAFSGAETTRITHAALSAIGSEIKSLAGAITDTWWRTTYTISGASPSFKLIHTLGIQ